MIAQEEIFGPVLCVITYDSEDEAIRIANDSRYGLHASVLRTDIQCARRVASQIRASAVNMANTGSRRFSKPAPYLSLKEALS